MNQTIAAQYRVGVWQRPTRDIHLNEAPRRGPVTFAIRIDERLDDVAADVFDPREIDVTHPVEVTAGYVQHAAYVQTAKQRWQGRAEDRRRVETGTGSRARFGVEPEIRLVNAGEPLLEAELGQRRPAPRSGVRLWSMGDRRDPDPAVLTSRWF